MSYYRLERATLQDLELIAPLFDEYRVFYGQEPDLEAADQFLRDRLASGESAVFMAVTGEGEGRRAGGFAQLYPSFSSVTVQRLWILNDLYVCSGERRQGLGRLLLEGAGEFARFTGAKGVTLTTAAGNTEAQRLYESQGYVRDDTFYTYDLFFGQ
ncbi:GNAT family N-acetyltransferase [Paenibacillus sp. PK3_47]|uniref:GNAT family N-acetyltransferase n=1 Tax=Paenibacillus sp. PK3_47 TaxID=2072642 RepID=UPI00201E4B79|nr:GNAT family N-acetyltransferase [Paenibacillus sp. PK3_47]UQZ35276.1 GNAT family N-acetyltransferase [Paenibacillus sp. PK3_47]